jgi:hypothetical protein
VLLRPLLLLLPLLLRILLLLLLLRLRLLLLVPSKLPQPLTKTLLLQMLMLQLLLPCKLPQLLTRPPRLAVWILVVGIMVVVVGRGVVPCASLTGLRPCSLKGGAGKGIGVRGGMMVGVFIVRGCGVREVVVVGSEVGEEGGVCAVGVVVGKGVVVVGGGVLKVVGEEVRMGGRGVRELMEHTHCLRGNACDARALGGVDMFAWLYNEGGHGAHALPVGECV